MIELHPEFITKNGRKEFAVLPYEEFLKLQEILEDLEDLRDLRLAEEEDKDSPDYSLEQVTKMLDIS
jgi:PHD/YefM family antitoxin component YafN of YafNO toxin-antitoxin module